MVVRPSHPRMCRRRRNVDGSHHHGAAAGGNGVGWTFNNKQPDQFHASSMNSRCLSSLGPSSISLHRGQDVLGTVSYRRN
jgi:hypothetical protein